MHVRGGYRIVTATTDTVDVTSDTADRDYAQGMTLLREVDSDPDFPTIAPVLDDFTRADENPLDNATWDTAIRAGQSFLELTSNTANASDDAEGGSFWLDTVTLAESDNSEVFCTISAVGAGSFPNSSQPLIGGVYLHAAGSAGAGTMEGRGVIWQRAGGQSVAQHVSFGGSGPGGLIGLQRLRIWAGTLSAGWKLGIQKRELLHHVWLDLGSGWEWVAAVFLGTDTTPTDRKFALQAFGTATVDDFGAGASVPVFVPQIIRRWRNR